jgi:glutathione synthase/RimK-type ligase-like ATP-grasp enzyme
VSAWRRSSSSRSSSGDTLPRRSSTTASSILELDHKPDLGVDVVLERCIQHSRALYALWVFGTWGIPTVNTFEVADICGNKLLTTMRLIRDGVPSPRTRVAFTPESRWWPPRSWDIRW